MKNTMITVSKETRMELQKLKLEFQHKSIDQTINYLLYELNKGGNTKHGNN